MQRGSITKRKDGRWMGRYYDHNKKQNCVYAKTKKECIDKLKKALKELDKTSKDTTFGKSMSLNSWFSYWLTTYKNGLKESSQINTKDEYKRNVENSIGDKPLNTLNAPMIKTFIDGLKTNSRKEKTYRILKDMLDKAWKNGLIKVNPMELFVLTINNPSEITEGKEKKEKYLSQEQIDIIFNKIKSPTYKSMLEFVLYTGLRAGEILALTWDDIDFENNTIAIKKQFNQTTKKIQTTKSKSSNRIIPLFTKAKELLTKIPKSNGTIFKGLENYSTYINIFSNTIGIKFSLHTFRHTFASRCKTAGIDDMTIQEWLGHESVKTTQDIYIHNSKDQKNNDITKMNEFLKANFDT